MFKDFLILWDFIHININIYIERDIYMQVKHISISAMLGTRRILDFRLLGRWEYLHSPPPPPPHTMSYFRAEVHN